MILGRGCRLHVYVQLCVLQTVGGVHLYKSEVAELFLFAEFVLVLPGFSVCCSSRIPFEVTETCQGKPKSPKVGSTLQESPCESAAKKKHMCNKLAAVLKSS